MVKRRRDACEGDIVMNRKHIIGCSGNWLYGRSESHAAPVGLQLYIYKIVRSLVHLFRGTERTHWTLYCREHELMMTSVFDILPLSLDTKADFFTFSVRYKRRMATAPACVPVGT